MCQVQGWHEQDWQCARLSTCHMHPCRVASTVSKACIHVCQILQKLDSLEVTPGYSLCIRSISFKVNATRRKLRQCIDKSDVTFPSDDLSCCHVRASKRSPACIRTPEYSEKISCCPGVHCHCQQYWTSLKSRTPCKLKELVAHVANRFNSWSVQQSRYQGEA